MSDSSLTTRSRPPQRRRRRRYEGPQTVVVTNQVPMATGGGPHGIVRILADEMVSNADMSPRPLLVVESNLIAWRDLAALSNSCGAEPSIPIAARLRRVLGQYRTLSRILKERECVRIVQFEVPRASLIVKALHPRRVHLTVSEHSKGGLDVEAKAASASPITIAKVRLSVRVSFAVADRIVWPSQGAIDEFHKVHRKRAREVQKYVVVHNGIRAHPRRGLRSAQSTSLKRLVIVAADVADKNVDGLLSVVAEALSDLPAGEYVVDWIGGPPERDLSAHQTIQVHARGTLSPESVRTALDESHAFIAFPHRTIFDLAVLEAMAAELPVICPPLTGFKEALGPDYPYYASTAVEFRRAIVELDDPAVRARTGQALRMRFERSFTARTMMLGYLAAPEGGDR